jgi:type II secretory pathway component PulK
MALLAVLVLIAVLGALVGSFVYVATIDLRLSENARDFARSEAALDGAEELARFLLRADYERDDASDEWVDHSSEIWSDGAAPFVERLNEQVAPASVTIRLTDAESRLDINRIVYAHSGRIGINARQEARAETVRLLTRLGHPDPKRVVAILVDWIDADDAGEYEREGPDRPLVSVHELKSVSGLANDAQWAELLDSGRLYQAFTTQHLDVGTVRDQGQVNVNTASLDVLAAVLDDPGLARRIVAGRPYQSINPDLKERIGIDAYRVMPRHRLTVRGQVFRLEAVCASGAAERRRTTVFARKHGVTLLRFRAPGCGARRSKR